MNIVYKFHLFNIITKCIRSFSENKLTSIEKELRYTKKDNVTLARYINARRKKDEAQGKEAQKNAEEEVRGKVMMVAPMSDEGQRSNDVWT
jgi:pyruvate/2-oxoacid:ferredoxin oxidoreductase beta subunit